MGTTIKKIIFRNDTSSNWNTNNPKLSDGELGIDNEKHIIKIGNGIDTWKTLSDGINTIISPSLDIIDNLDSDRTDAALSAKQGKTLKDLLMSKGFIEDAPRDGNYYARHNKTWKKVTSDKDINLTLQHYLLFHWDKYVEPNQSPSIKWSDMVWSEELKLFVVISYNTTNNKATKFKTSPDGITWTLRSLPTNAQTGKWKSICWAPEIRKFCVVGESNVILTSSNGITWTSHSLPNNQVIKYTKVCWAPELNMFCVIASSDSYNKFLTSSDGITWTERSVPANSYDWCDIIWSSKLSMFLAISKTRAANYATSSDGITWTLRNYSGLNSSYVPNMAALRVIYDPKYEMFVLYFTQISSPNQSSIVFYCTYSYDGINWSYNYRSISSNLYSVTTINNVNLSICYSPFFNIWAIVNNFTKVNETYPSFLTYIDDHIDYVNIYTNISKSPFFNNIDAETFNINASQICWAPSLGRFCMLSLNNNMTYMSYSIYDYF